MTFRLTGTLILLVLAVAGIAQTNNRFYASLRDVAINNPLKEFEIKDSSWSAALGTESLKIVSLGNEAIKATSDFPSDLYIYQNVLHRRWNGKNYLVLTAGPVNYYALKADHTKQFTSESITSGLKEFRQKDFDKMLKKHNLLDRYRAEKPVRHPQENINEYFNRLVAVNIKYFKLVNSKLNEQNRKSS